MKAVKRYFLLLVTILYCALTFGQAGVFNPADPVVNYNAASPPANPVTNQITKWVRTPRMNWDATQFKCYIFQGVQFRVMFPKTYVHNVADGKKYPVAVFLHGLGERGTIYDNEYSLLHGGQTFRDRVNNGSYDGFLVYPQFGSTNTGWGSSHFGTIAKIVDSMAKYIKADLDRVFVHGLSIGGQGTWKLIEEYPKVFAGAGPISGASLGYIAGIPKYVEVPIRLYTGDKDNNPAPGTAVALVDSFKGRGGNIVHVRYPTQGHGCWNTAWAEPAWLPFMNSIHKANPIVYFGRSEFCPGDPVSAVLGLTAGFNAYEWEKDGVVIAGATTNKLTVTSFGTYRARFRRTATSAWSEWSPTPVVVRIKPPTVTPPVQIDGLYSNVLPATDGKTTVPLTVVGDFTSYEWRNVANDQVVANTKIFNAPVGTYKVRVTELYGCSSAFSPDFIVVNANGSSGLPDAAGGLLAVGASKTTIQLDWSDNPAPGFNETGFEVYRSNTAGGTYTLIAKTGANSTSFLDGGLDPNTSYYYVVRAVNENGASALSAEATGKTQVDDTAPETPRELVVSATSSSSISLQWNPSTDDVGVDKYDVYVNGAKAYSTSTNVYTVYNLNQFEVYNFQVKARDAAGNISPFSNQVTGQAANSGLNYKLYNGTWSSLPNFATLTPIQSGKTAVADISVRNRETNYGFLWEGKIKIPVTGSYTFETCSDDGSKLYIGSYSHSAVALVNNDGSHGNQCRTGTINLTAGVHPIAITFFQGGGGFSMQTWWTSTAAGIARQQIPASAFDESIPFAGTAPSAPSGLKATTISFSQIDLQWNDNSGNETGFEIGRATTKTGPFVTIATVGAGVTNYSDNNGLAANTRYFYRVRSIGQYGESVYSAAYAEARWQMNNNSTDATGGANTISLVNGAAYNTTANEGSHSILFDGSNDYVDVSGPNNFLKAAFNARTVSLWMKADLFTNTRILYDFGGSDNGLALRLNANKLEAAVVRGNTNRVLSIPFTSTNWTHVAVVYAGSTIKMYVNGVLAAENLALPFTSILSTTNSSRLGIHNSGNAFRSNASNYYKGRIDDLRVIDADLDLSDVNALMNNSYLSSDVFTNVLPATPVAASNLIATATTSSNVEVTWTDNASNESAFDVYRSLGNNANYRKIATVDAISGTGASGSFTDNSLFANVIYYYKVIATGVGGNSVDSNEDSAKTNNDQPVISAISNATMKFATIKNFAISATDPNGDPVVITAPGLPAFATLVDNGNGTGTITFAPQLADLGTYVVNVEAADNNGGVSTSSYTVLVNENNPPTLSTPVLGPINEGASTNVTIEATDLDGQTGLSITGQGLPAFVTLVDNGNGTASLTAAPGYADGDTYTFTLTVTDSQGASDSKEVTVLVNEIVPNEKILINIQKTSAAAAPWNNAVGLNTTNLKNTAGVNTGAGLQFQTTAWNTFDQGPVTGSNSGLYPDAVIKDYYYFGIFGAPNTVSVRATGLNPTKSYKFSFYAGSKWTGAPDNGTTVFSIGAQSASLYVQNNSQNKVSLDNIVPDASGVVTFTMAKASGTPAGYLNALEIESAFNDGLPPAAPKNFAIALIDGGGVKLTWKDAAYNETSYEVERSLEPDANFALLNPAAANMNTTSYDDLSVVSSTTYYYRIRSVNANGSSNYSPVLSIVTGNKTPIITAASTLYVKTDATQSLTFTVTDDASDVLTVQAANLPAFASLVDNGGGSYSVVASPLVSHIGVFKNIQITATDDKGAVATKVISISVSDKNTNAIYVNLGSDNMGAGSPWNNFLGYPMGTKNAQNLRDEDGVQTTVDITLMQQWAGTTDLGHITTDNSGIFEDQVIASGIYDANSTPKQIKFTGLVPGKLYNFGFFGSINGGSDASATITSGTQSVVLQSRYNNSNTARLNGLQPDANNEIIVTLTKTATSTYAYLNAIVIESYDPIITTLAPIGLKAEAASRTSIALSWSERAADETGYEIWRATAGGSYAVVGTVSANSTSYVDAGLSSGTYYHYLVRALTATGGSEFSNAATALTPGSIVYLHFTNQYPAPAPWNNTNRLPQVNDSYDELLNDEGNNTGFAVNLETAFNGEFWAGMNTGNNSGVFPDPVMISSYWIDNGQKVRIRIDNLNQALKYKLGFFASANWAYNLTTSYTVNGKTRYLNASYNTTRVEYLDELVPNGNGEIFIDISTNTIAQFGFLGALVIQGYSTAPAGAAPAVPLLDPPAPIVKKAPVVNTVEAAKKVVVANELKANLEASAYPNPFRNELMIRVASKDPKIGYQVQLMNTSGIILTEKTVSMAKGNTVSINVSALHLDPGMYFARILVDGKVEKTIKLLKVE